MINILQTLGLAYKAKRILIGEDIITSLKTKKVVLIILTSDVSDNTRKRFHDKAKFYDVDIIESFTKSDLGEALGKGYVSAIGILDNKLKDKILNFEESR
ncbi:MAG: ribosomal L7Ae/L30e/S12e/Gadd45 family protein [Erysipelotrichales bacterium]|nr:ribosomal L7Ae/L30e/S12e/Gadd45 family protein [Erysipelotrichales bacterium]